MVTINILLQNMDSRHMTLSIHSLVYAAVITNWLGYTELKVGVVTRVSSSQ